MSSVNLLTLDPGHFHAALVQKEMYPNVSPRVHVYAPLGPDLIAHLNRILSFNTRQERPTAWELDVHAGADFLERMLRDRPGNVVVLSGRNRRKIDYLLAAVNAGLHVLADKPWIISADDMPKLAEVLRIASAKRLIACDIMTERYEITSILQRAFVSDADVFGTAISGSEQEPGVFMESMHYLLKTVAGSPLRRPVWFFDTTQQGEGLTDVGTHLVDLVPWILFPQQPIDHAREVQVLRARRWPTYLSLADFQRVTGETEFPAFLTSQIQDERLAYYCNTEVVYQIRGVHTKLNVLWDYAASAGGGDTHFAVFRGTRARVEVRQGQEQNYRPELCIVPNRIEDAAALQSAVGHRTVALQRHFPGLSVDRQGSEIRLVVPDVYRVGHEAHFAEVTRQFLAYLERPESLPAWETPNMLAKYFVTTQGVSLSRRATC